MDTKLGKDAKDLEHIVQTSAGQLRPGTFEDRCEKALRELIAKKASRRAGSRLRKLRLRQRS
jgi:non-homologous end joining protein Ku